MTTSDKISNLRKLMEKYYVDAYVIPSGDPHISEYLPEYWKARQWISGFTGSAGTFAITKKHAALWVDSRYFLQAEEELKGSGIEICKIGLAGTPTLEDWIIDHLNKKDTLGFDGIIFPVSIARSIIEKLRKKSIKVNQKLDLIKPIWKERPKLPKSKAFDLELRYTGVSVTEKLNSIRQQLKAKGASSYLMCALDEICWTFNIRGNDIPFNPVVISYGFISKDKAIVFVDIKKLDEIMVNNLHEQGVEVKPYNSIEKHLRRLKKKQTIFIDPARTNYYLYSIIPYKVKILEGMGIVTELKSRKNSVELEGFRQSMIQDGVAMVEFWHWLESNNGKIRITETQVSDKLKELRGKRNGFICEGFTTIAGYADHGAIVHYQPTKDKEYEIKPEGYLLYDSGGQYITGTTDITRTVHLGKPLAQEKIDYTLVLKGMIQLSMVRFPAGTRGSQLDTLARIALWQNGINYGHGTGHGVGSFLNVHEGPMQIRPDNHLPIEVGVVMSNEPGLYRTGKYGIRIENMITCTIDIENEFGRFLKFETLTLSPIDIKPVKIEMLTEDEREWLNSYHEHVYEKLSPFLNIELKSWLKQKTKSI